MNQFVTLPIESPIQIHQPVFRDDGSLPPPEPVVSARMPKINLPLGDNPTLSYKDLNNNFYDNIPKLVAYTRNGMFGKWLLARDDLKDLYDSFQDYLDINQSDIDVFAQLCEVMGIEFNQSKAKAQCENNKLSHKVTDKVFSKVSEVIQNENVQSAMTQAKTLAGGLFSKAEEVIKEKVQPKIDTESLKGSGFFSSFFNKTEPQSPKQENHTNNDIFGKNIFEQNSEIPKENKSETTQNPDFKPFFAEEPQQNQNSKQNDDPFADFGTGKEYDLISVKLIHESSIQKLFVDQLLNDIKLVYQKQLINENNYKYICSSIEKMRSDKHSNNYGRRKYSPRNHYDFRLPPPENQDVKTAFSSYLHFCYGQPLFHQNNRFVAIPLLKTKNIQDSSGYERNTFEFMPIASENISALFYDCQTQKITDYNDLPENVKQWILNHFDLLEKEYKTFHGDNLHFLKSRNYWSLNPNYNLHKKYEILNILSKDKSVGLFFNYKAERDNGAGRSLPQENRCLIIKNSKLIEEHFAKKQGDANIFDSIFKLDTSDYLIVDENLIHNNFHSYVLTDKYFIYAVANIDRTDVTKTTIDLNALPVYENKQQKEHKFFSGIYSVDKTQKTDRDSDYSKKNNFVKWTIKLVNLKDLKVKEICTVETKSMPYYNISHDNKHLIVYSELENERNAEITQTLKHYELDS